MTRAGQIRKALGSPILTWSRFPLKPRSPTSPPRVHLSIAPLQRRRAHSQVWRTGIRLLTRGGRHLITPDPSSRLSPCSGPCYPAGGSRSLHSSRRPNAGVQGAFFLSDRAFDQFRPDIPVISCTFDQLYLRSAVPLNSYTLH